MACRGMQPAYMTSHHPLQARRRHLRHSHLLWGPPRRPQRIRMRGRQERSQRHCVGVQAGRRAAPRGVRRDCLCNLLRRARRGQLQDIQGVLGSGRLTPERCGVIVARCIHCGEVRVVCLMLMTVLSENHYSGGAGSEPSRVLALEIIT